MSLEVEIILHKEHVEAIVSGEYDMQEAVNSSYNPWYCAKADCGIIYSDLSDKSL